MPQFQNKSPYRYTQVPSPLVQPGGPRSLLHPKGTVVIGEENAAQRAHKKPNMPVRPGAGGVAPKAHKTSRQQLQEIKLEREQPVTKKSSKLGCIVVVLILLFAMVGLIDYARNSIVGSIGSPSGIVSTVVEEIEGFLDDEDEYIYNWAEKHGYGDIEMAYFGRGGLLYYYSEDCDAVLCEDHRVWEKNDDSVWMDEDNLSLLGAADEDDIINEDVYRKIFPKKKGA